MGTIIVSGRAKGIVVETGLKTILGRIARDVRELSVTETPLQRKIVRFAQYIGLLVLASAIAIIVLGLILGMSVASCSPRRWLPLLPQCLKDFPSW